MTALTDTVSKVFFCHFPDTGCSGDKFFEQLILPGNVFFAPGTAGCEDASISAKVAVVIDQTAFGGFPIPAGPADLLEIPVQGQGEPSMDDHTDIGDVNPQAKSGGSHHDLCLSTYEVQLPLLPLLSLCLAVQMNSRETTAFEQFVNLFDSLWGGAVHDCS